MRQKISYKYKKTFKNIKYTNVLIMLLKTDIYIFIIIKENDSLCFNDNNESL